MRVPGKLSSCLLMICLSAVYCHLARASDEDDGQAGMVEVSFRTNPPGASLSLNDRPHGKTPVDLRLLAGESYLVKMKLQGQTTFDEVIAFSKANRRLFVDLGAAQPAGIELKSAPQGARIYIDEALAGTTPAIIWLQPAKEYKLSLEKEGFDKITRCLTARGQRINFALDEKNEALSSNEPGSGLVCGEVPEDGDSADRKVEEELSIEIDPVVSMGVVAPWEIYDTDHSLPGLGLSLGVGMRVSEHLATEFIVSAKFMFLMISVDTNLSGFWYPFEDYGFYTRLGLGYSFHRFCFDCHSDEKSPTISHHLSLPIGIGYHWRGDIGFRFEISYDPQFVIEHDGYVNRGLDCFHLTALQLVLTFG